MAELRPVRLPSAQFSEIELPVSDLNGVAALRIHSAAYPAVQFRLVPSHRFSHLEAPGGLLYLGMDATTCLWECFGDGILEPQSRIPRARWSNSTLSEVHSRATFRICDLTDTKVRRHLKVDLSALMHTDLSIPQAWGLALQSHPDEIDGLRYLSRFTNRPCLALFERPGALSRFKSQALDCLPGIEEACAFLDENRIALV